MKTLFEIIINMIDIIEAILEKREERGLKYYIINFDKFKYDKYNNILVFEDQNIFRMNYHYNLIMTDEYFEEGNNMNKKSLQPFVYDKKVNSYFSKLELYNSGKYDYNNCKRFHSIIMINFLNKIFNRVSINNKNPAFEIYEKFRLNFLNHLKNSIKNTQEEFFTLANLKNFLFSVYKENPMIDQILNTYEDKFIENQIFSELKISFVSKVDSSLSEKGGNSFNINQYEEDSKEIKIHLHSPSKNIRKEMNHILIENTRFNNVSLFHSKNNKLKRQSSDLIYSKYLEKIDKCSRTILPLPH
jgi:hypothetical protein